MIRKATASDITRVQSIANDAYQPYVAAIGRDPAPMIADFKAAQIAGELYVFDAPPVSGFIVFQTNGSVGHIENVAVAPSSHQNGIGRTLIEFTEAACRSEGATRLTLYTNIHMVPNLTYYPYLGFHETGRRHENGFDRVYFEKRIKPE